MLPLLICCRPPSRNRESCVGIRNWIAGLINLPDRAIKGCRRFSGTGCHLHYLVDRRTERSAAVLGCSRGVVGFCVAARPHIRVFCRSTLSKAHAAKLALALAALRSGQSRALRLSELVGQHT